MFWQRPPFLLVLLQLCALPLFAQVNADKLVKEASEIASFNANKALQLTDQAIQIYSRDRSLKKLGNAYAIKGNILLDQGDFHKSMQAQLNALNYANQAGDSLTISSALHNIGNIYLDQDENNQASEYYFKALKMASAIHNEENMAKCWNNLGLVYYNLGNYQQALAYYDKAMSVFTKNKDEMNMANLYNNYGILFRINNEYARALVAYNKSLAIRNKLKDTSGVASIYNNLAALSSAKKDIVEAEKYFKASLKLYLQMNDRLGACLLYNNLSSLYNEQSNHKLAKAFADSALHLSLELHAIDEIKFAHENMYEVLYKTSKYKEAIEHLKLAGMYKDSIFNSDNIESVTKKEAQFQFEKEQEKQKLIQAQKEQSFENEVRRQKQARNFMIAISGLFLLFAFFMVRAFIAKKKANEMLGLQKTEISAQRFALIEKNKEITDSINYAKKIQEALIPNNEFFRQFFEDSFVYFKAKDIVSGDFLWIEKKEDYIFYATADCTGHGVPGGFMSMLGISMLNEIIGNKQVFEPSDILNQLREAIIKALKQKGAAGESKDGMDLTLIRIDFSKKEICYASANNSFYFFDAAKNIVQEFTPDKMPIGYYENMNLFKQHKMTYNHGDAIYTFTDGIADQFGGPKGKKFKYKQLEDAIKTNALFDMKVQYERIAEKIESWKGNLEQTDDMALVGIRL